MQSNLPDLLTYLNSGDWVENLTALEYTPEAGWQLCFYHDDPRMQTAPDPGTDAHGHPDADADAHPDADTDPDADRHVAEHHAAGTAAVGERHQLFRIHRH